MQLIIGNKVINAPITDVLETLRKETGYRYFREIKLKGNNYTVTCPFHKMGQESHASCQVFCDEADPKVEYGYFHCFTCGENAHLYDVVAHCFSQNADFGKEWLLERFGNTFIQYEETLTDIILDKPKKTFLNPNILEEYNYYHPYMWKRNLTKEVVDKFQVGFDPKTQSITFPVWDQFNNLVMVTKRSVNTKNFFIPEDVEKPVYLLNFLLQEKQTTAYICESQINALTLQGWGYPAVALFGTGSEQQMKILNKSGIRHYYLCFDGDTPGNKAINRFKKNIRKDVLVDVVRIPFGKDVNDLTEKEFKNLEII